MLLYILALSIFLNIKINRKYLQIGRYSFSLEDMNCMECISQTIPTSMFGMIQHETADHLAKIIIELINPNFEQKDQPVFPEMLLKVDLEPFQMLLHQKVMEFLMEFVLNSQNEILTKKALIEEEKEVKKVEMPIQDSSIFIQRITISPFYVKFNYRSYKLRMSKLYNKEFLQLLNIADIRDLIVSFNKFEGRGFNSTDLMLNQMIQQYTKEMLNTQAMMTYVTGNNTLIYIF